MRGGGHISGDIPQDYVPPFNAGQEFVSRSADTALSIIHGVVYFPADAIIRLGMTALTNSIILSTGTRIS